MKVWIVFEIYFPRRNKDIVGVFTSFKKAGTFMNSLPAPPGKNFYLIVDYKVHS